MTRTVIVVLAGDVIWGMSHTGSGNPGWGACFPRMVALGEGVEENSTAK